MTWKKKIISVNVFNRIQPNDISFCTPASKVIMPDVGALVAIIIAIAKEPSHPKVRLVYQHDTIYCKTTSCTLHAIFPADDDLQEFTIYIPLPLPSLYVTVVSLRSSIVFL